MDKDKKNNFTHKTHHRQKLSDLDFLMFCAFLNLILMQA
jgi:hypothetical protein